MTTNTHLRKSVLAVFSQELRCTFDRLFEIWFEYADAPRRLRTTQQLENYFEKAMKQELKEYLDNKDWTLEDIVWGTPFQLPQSDKIAEESQSI